MSDTETSPAPPPFDEVKAADSELDQDGEQQSSVLSSAWLRLALIALFVAAIGFGQGLGLTLLFDRPPEGLNVSDHEPAEKLSSGTDEEPTHDEAVQAVPEEQADSHRELAPTRVLHELEVARERFDMGDVEWARRTAAAFLLRMDGLGHEDTSRSSEAYAMLADVLRHEYERSLCGSQREELPEAGSQEEE